MINQQIQDFILEIKNNLNRSYWFTPLNFQKEKQKFFASKTYNPQFVYPKKNIELLQKYLEKLEDLKLKKDNSIENYYWRQSQKEIILRLKLALSQGTSEFSNISQKLYQVNFSENLIKKAKTDSNSKEDILTGKIINSQQILEKTKQYLEKNNIQDWQVDFDNNRKDFSMRVKPKLKHIWIKKGLTWHEQNLDNLLAHEIDGHVFRSLNAHNQTSKILQKQFPFYLKTEEGLASYLEDYFSKTGKYSLKKRALKYLGCHIASQFSFRETFNFFVKNQYGGNNKNLAYKVTTRIKKGFSDTKKPGFFARELTYYQGMQEIKEYIENRGNINKLFSGKFGLKDLDKIKAQKNILLPNRIK